MPLIALLCGLALAEPIPFSRLESGHLVVQTSLADAQPMPFLLDTGASTTVIDTEIWHDTGHELKGRKIHVHGAGGKVEARIVGEVELRIGSQTVTVPHAVVMPLGTKTSDSHIAGILGRDAMVDHRVELDFEKSQMSLHGEDDPVNGDGCADAPTVKLRGGLLGVDISVGEDPVPAVVDLGAGLTILSSAAAALPGIESVGGAAQGSGIDATALELVTVRIRDLSIGDAYFGSVDIYSGDLPVFGTLRMEGPAAILGVDVLAKRRLIIDYVDDRLRMCPLSGVAP